MTIISFDFPYFAAAYYNSNDVSSARPGRVIDAELISGGLKLWHGHRHLIIELHPLRASQRAIATHLQHTKRNPSSTM